MGVWWYSSLLASKYVPVYPPSLQVRVSGFIKIVVNHLLRRTGGFNVPRGCIFSDGPDVIKTMQEANVPFAVVAKPIRGRDNHAVKFCKSLDGFVDHARSLFSESPHIMVEEFLAGEEATVTVMPPTQGGDTK